MRSSGKKEFAYWMKPTIFNQFHTLIPVSNRLHAASCAVSHRAACD